MEDDRTAETVDHLQAAARELLCAARSFLAVVEEVVEDRDRLAGAASSLVDLLRDGVSGAAASARSSTGGSTASGSAPMEPWERVAWGVEEPGDDTDGEPVEPMGEPVVVLDDPPADPSPPRRVRRISVD